MIGGRSAVRFWPPMPQGEIVFRSYLLCVSIQKTRVFASFFLHFLQQNKNKDFFVFFVNQKSENYIFSHFLWILIFFQNFWFLPGSEHWIWTIQEAWWFLPGSEHWIWAIQVADALGVSTSGHGFRRFTTSSPLTVYLNHYLLQECPQDARLFRFIRVATLPFWGELCVEAALDVGPNYERLSDLCGFVFLLCGLRDLCFWV